MDFARGFALDTDRGYYLYRNVSANHYRICSQEPFFGNIPQQSLGQEDLNFSFIKFNRNEVDLGKGEVTSRFLIWKSKAVYNEGLGCTLVRDFSEDKVLKMDYPEVSLPPCNPDTIPSKHLVVVRTGHSPSGTCDFKAFLKSISDSVEM